MQIIGRNLQGGVLIEMSIGEYATIKSAAAIFGVDMPVPASVMTMETWYASTFVKRPLSKRNQKGKNK
jgi:hypothetical protein